ncbi:histidine triad nucleotide-binding protein [Candidatus Obscuribacterales bacterium]|jgi:histidine triad (HIT) family protein|nr:histidine triad nucleotide-binding protein [Candidatus Obscuribacterales bacterium]MBX3136048.1 histidine triad nucleotide-binding protein [Candidatus Obscuribacterales bacterium]MBX3148827.1 histidine triad nucleotide-binding protein [Candidatus Obscuribacterales bacterium]
MSPSGTSDPNCLFCKITRKDIPANIVSEDDEFVAFRDINAQAPSHVLVIPKEHIRNISEAGDAEQLGKLFQKACQVARSEKLDGGFRVVVNTGDDAGQTVHHVHVHVMGGRRMNWPPG